MNTLKTLILFFLASISYAGNSQNAIYLKADSVYKISFPDLPKTMWSEITGIDKPSQMSFYLPENYSSEKKFPLFLWIGGGSGGNGDNPSKGMQITNKKDFICMNLPLYKDNIPPLLPDSSNYWSRMVLPHSDSTIIWKCYKIMLDSLFQIIPNINKELTFIGGFSNGAHTTAILLDRPKVEIMNYFNYFYFVEGGSRCQNTFVLKNKPLLIFQGDNSEPDWMIPVYERAKKDDVYVEFVMMKNTGHSFPKKYNKILLKWINKIIKKNT